MNKLIYGCLLGATCIAGSVAHAQENWVPIQGRVQAAAGSEPLCAVVLANGQYQFSCDGNGFYDFDVPLDASGGITVFVFADGYAPYKKESLYAHDFPLTAALSVASTEAPEIDLDTQAPECLNGLTQARLQGRIFNDAGAPLSAMVLANGELMFSDAAQGGYDLTVNLNENNGVELFVGADGHQPWKSEEFTPCADAYRQQVERMLGDWYFQTTVSWGSPSNGGISTNSRNFWFYSRAQESESKPGSFYLEEDLGTRILTWNPQNSYYTMTVRSNQSEDYEFILNDQNNGVGCKYQVDMSTQQRGGCQSLRIWRF